MSNSECLYRIIFSQQGKSYEIYAKYISEDHLMGFIEVEEIVFSPPSSSMLVDPSEEKLRSEFKGVKRSYIPMHAIARIDEVVKQGPARIIEISEKNGDNVSRFRGPVSNPEKEKL